MPKKSRMLRSWHKSGKMNMKRNRRKHRRKKTSMMLN
jgi:hypothetical protein